MLFSSITFIAFFLPIVLFAYYFCPQSKIRNILLLFASLFFYAWGEPKYIIIMLFSILINYRIGIFLNDKNITNLTRKFILAIGICANILLLFYFKYFGFSLLVINKLLRIINYSHIQFSFAQILLPIGISFYTFQSMSYLVDVYKNPTIAERNILDLGLYISFFPALIAGPIIRYHDINEQIKKRETSLNLFISGIERFIIGLSKKVLIANIMASFADKIFALQPGLVSFNYLALGIICYTLQIYYDFSGYSDMAIGFGRMFGFKILENFNYPYISKSITEFWRRWHISLSNWFRDYLYIPLGGNRKGKIRTIINLFLVFLITGLWHGAAINFIIWGLGHGILLFIEKSLNGVRIFKNKYIKDIFSHIYTLFSVIILWIFFRLDFRTSFRFLFELITLNKGNDIENFYISIAINNQLIICLIIAIVFSFPWWKKIDFNNLFFIMPIKYCICIILLILSISQLAINAYNPFIYFRF